MSGLTLQWRPVRAISERWSGPVAGVRPLAAVIGPMGVAGPPGPIGPAGPAGPQGPSGGAQIAVTIEADLGPLAKRSGRFTIAVSGQVPGKPVQIWQAPGPYSGKGFARADEAEMDSVHATASLVSPSLIEVFWRCRHRVRGAIKFTYQIGD